jgi:hypothetical protein
LKKEKMFVECLILTRRPVTRQRCHVTDPTPSNATLLLFLTLPTGRDTLIIPHLVIHSFSSRVQIPPAPGATRSPASLPAPPAPRLPSPSGTAPSPPSAPVVTPPFPLLVSSHLPSPASQRAASHDERFRGRRWAGLPRARAGPTT